MIIFLFLRYPSPTLLSILLPLLVLLNMLLPYGIEMLLTITIALLGHLTAVGDGDGGLGLAAGLAEGLDLLDHVVAVGHLHKSVNSIDGSSDGSSDGQRSAPVIGYRSRQRSKDGHRL